MNELKIGKKLEKSTIIQYNNFQPFKDMFLAPITWE